MIANALKTRKEAAMNELSKIINDKKAVPINYNHYYTDNVHKKRAERIEAQIKKHFPNSTSSASTTSRCNLGTHYHKPDADIKEELERAISNWKDGVTADMEEFSCEESLDCLEAIYKVSDKLETSLLNKNSDILTRKNGWYTGTYHACPQLIRIHTYTPKPNTPITNTPKPNTPKLNIPTWVNGLAMGVW